MTTEGPEEDQVHVALLRGINVGGKNLLPMNGLAEVFTALGCTGVRTYLQSGNVVFTTCSAINEMELGAAVSSAIARQFGPRVPVVLRSAREMRRTVGGNPFVKARVAGELLHVYFLADPPDADAVKKLDYERSPGDSYVIAGREIYLHLPGGVARTKLTNVYFDRALGTVSTLRNWRTCVALAAMLQGAEVSARC